MNAPQFKDYAKLSRGLFDDNYNKDSFGFKGKISSTKDLKFELGGKLKDDQFESFLKWSETYQPPQNKAVFSLIGTVHSNGNFEFDPEVNLKEEGVTVAVHGKLSAGADKDLLVDEDKEAKEFRDSLGGELKYVSKQLSGSFQIDKKKKNPLRITASASVVPVDNLAIGGSVKFKEQKFDKFDVGARFQRDNLTLSWLAEDSCRKSKLSLHQDISRDLTGGVELTRVSKNCKDKEVPWDMSAAFAYKLNPTSKVKGLLSSSSKEMKLSFITDLNADLSASMTTNTTLSTLKTDGFKFGLQYEPK
jgi:hypothetical protein